MQNPARVLSDLALRPHCRIAVVRALQLGDLLCSVPAFRALRAAVPRAHMTLVGLPWAESFVARWQRYFDDFWEFPGFPGLPERSFSLAAVGEFFRRSQRAHFDLVIQMHGSGSYINTFVASMGAQRTAGFYPPEDFCPSGSTYLAYPEHEHEIWRHLRLMEFLGSHELNPELEFPIEENDRAALRELQSAERAIPVADVQGGNRELLCPGTYICIHPGARFASRRWPISSFAAVADALGKEGWLVVITGSADEADLGAQLSRRLHVRHLNFAGRTSLGAVAALVQQARLVITNDTGMSHLAAAVKTPSVVVVTGSDPKRWAPLDRRRHRVVRYAVDCQPCEHRDCPIGHPCALRLRPEDVLKTVDQALGELANPSNGRSSASTEYLNAACEEESCAGSEC